jgi:hypothetical protein
MTVLNWTLSESPPVSGGVFAVLPDLKALLALRLLLLQYPVPALERVFTVLRLLGRRASE